MSRCHPLFGAIFTLVLLLSTTTFAAPQKHACVPLWDRTVNINERLGLPQQVLAPFCLPTSVVNVREPYIPLSNAVTAPDSGSEECPIRYPADYAPPPGLTPMDDLLSKIVEVRYVVDMLDVDRTKTYVFPGLEAAHVYADNVNPNFPDSFRQVIFAGILPPLKAGHHTVDIFLTLSARYCPGVSDDPEQLCADQLAIGECIPGGANPWFHYDFDVAGPR